MKSLALLTVLAFSSITAGAQAAKAKADEGIPVAEWTVYDKTSALDGHHDFAESLLSVTRIGPLNEPVMLTVFCTRHEMTVGLSWPGYVGNTPVFIEWGTDGGPVTQESWFNIGLKSIWTKNVDQARKITVAIAHGKQLVMRVSAYEYGQDVIFDVHKAADAVAKVAQICP